MSSPSRNQGREGRRDPAEQLRRAGESIRALTWETKRIPVQQQKDICKLLYKQKLLTCIPEKLTGIASEKNVFVGKRGSEKLSSWSTYALMHKGANKGRSGNNGGKDISLCFLDISFQMFSRGTLPTPHPL